MREVYTVQISESYVNSLRARVSEYMDERRYSHTLGVCDTAAWLAGHIMPDMLLQLRCAALLHDIAKCLTRDEQLDLIKGYGVAVDNRELDIVPAIHSYAAVAVIRRDFPELASEDVLSAVYNHTVGRAGMSLFDEIIFLSDYIEPSRAYQSSREVRNIVYSGIEMAHTLDEKIKVIHLGVLRAAEATVLELCKRGAIISSRTQELIADIKNKI